MSTTAKVVTKTPPPIVRHFSVAKPKTELRQKIEALTKGQCLEIRGEGKKANGYSSYLTNATKSTGKKYTLRNLPEGVDIYCLG